MREKLIAWLWPVLAPRIERLVADMLRKHPEPPPAKPARAHFGRKPE
jgi:hypothetical protein